VVVVSDSDDFTKADRQTFVRELIGQAPREEQRDLFREAMRSVDEAVQDEVADDLIGLIAQDDGAKTRYLTEERLKATEGFREKRAEALMQKHDQAFDEYVDLTAYMTGKPISPTVCALSDGSGSLFYEGYRNGVFGPSEAGKTWLAGLATMQEIQAGRPVSYLDYENGRWAFTGRLVALGAMADQIALVRYYDMDGPPPSPEQARKMAATMRAANGRLVIVDATTGAMDSMGLDQRAENDVESYYSKVGDPWADEGLAWVTLDHCPLADPFRPLGSQRKTSGIYGMNVNVIGEVKFSRMTAGYSRVYINKDRHGGGPETFGERRQVGELHVVPAEVAVDGIGVIELRPFTPDVRDERKREKEAEAAAERGLRVMSLRVRVNDYVRKYGDADGNGPGVFKGWMINGYNPKDRDPAPKLGGRTDEVYDAVEANLADPDDQLMLGPDGRRLMIGPMVIPSLVTVESK
jgi:hypothetical protein